MGPSRLETQSVNQFLKLRSDFMKRIGWTMMLIGVALLTTGCPKPGAEQPASQETITIPENVDGEKVSKAVGTALLKGITKSTSSDDSSESTPNP